MKKTDERKRLYVPGTMPQSVREAREEYECVVRERLWRRYDAIESWRKLAYVEGEYAITRFRAAYAQLLESVEQLRSLDPPPKSWERKALQRVVKMLNEARGEEAWVSDMRDDIKEAERDANDLKAWESM